MEKQEIRVLAARVFERSFDDFCVWVAGIVSEQCPALAVELRQMLKITKFGQAFAAIQRHGQGGFVSSNLSAEARKRDISAFGLNKWVDLSAAWNEDITPGVVIVEDEEEE